MADPETIWREYLWREDIAKATPQGPDHKAIIEDIAENFDVDPDWIKDLIIERSISRGAG